MSMNSGHPCAHLFSPVQNVLRRKPYGERIFDQSHTYTQLFGGKCVQCILMYCICEMDEMVKSLYI